MLTIQSTVTLNNGVQMPMLGLGTFQSENGETARDAVLWALEAGYRHIDTAALYANEESVGEAIKASGIPREQIFVTTKVWNGDQGYETTLRAFDTSLKRLNMDYVDLYLVHWPIRETREETWRALLKIAEGGRVRAIGVSNFVVRHLKELLAWSPVVPAVNQFEIHPYLTRVELVDFCKQQGIQVESYSPLVRGKKFNDPTLMAVAQRCGKSPAQVMVRWSLQKGLVVIPKSVRRERILENADVYDFEISAADMAVLDALNENLHTIRPGFMEGEWE